MIIDFRTVKDEYNPITINNEKIEVVESYKYLGVLIDNKLKWNLHALSVQSKLNKRMYFMRKLIEFKIDRRLLTIFYRSVMESVITFCITAWAGNVNKYEINKIDNVIKRVGKWTDEVSGVHGLFCRYSLSKLSVIVKDPKHPLYKHITFSKRTNRLLSVRTRTERHKNSFIPFSIRIFNSNL